MEIKEIQQILNQNNFKTHFESDNSEALLDRLLVLAPNDEESKVLLEILYVPNTEDQLDGNKLLQFFVVVLEDVKESTEEELRRLILKLNHNTSLMGWGFDEEGFVYFRHILMLSKATNFNENSVLIDTIWMIFYLIDSFYTLIKAVATGEKTLAEVV